MLMVSVNYLLLIASFAYGEEKHLSFIHVHPLVPLFVTAGGRVPLERGGRVRVEDEEDYGDYVTRCICEFKHDDGYMML